MRNTKMISYKIPIIFMVLFLMPTSFAKPLDDNSNFFDSSEEEMRKNPTPSQKVLLYTFDNFVLLGKQIATNAANVSRHILKDESLVANTKPEIVEFKQNLTMFVEKYEANKNPLLMWEILEIYTNVTDHYYEVPQEKVTPETIFVADILNKYNTKDVIVQFAKDFVKFMDDFVIMFEENKADVEKSLLDWYEKYKTLDDMEDKIDAFSDFIQL